ncbi:MAG: hypothetical protein ACF8NJ_07375, partial [Phycisphaerales bacterium JB038]
RSSDLAAVRRVRCDCGNDGVRILAEAAVEAGSEQFYAQRKADLLERALDRAVRVECRLGSPAPRGGEP